MSDVTDTYRAIKELAKQDKQDRLVLAEQDFPYAASKCIDGLSLVKCSNVHFQLKCKAGWIVNVYPSKQRLLGDRNRVSAPFLQMPGDRDWTLIDVVNAANAVVAEWGCDRG
jgi:hypothetical protein